jgi:hypothetical protein
MKEDFSNTPEGQEDQPVSGSQDSVKFRTDLAEDVRSGARQEDQLEGLHPGDDPELKNNSNRLGCPPVTHVNNGSPEHQNYPNNGQRWPENGEPSK